MRRLLAEAIGTCILVFAGTGAIAANAVYGTVTHVGVSLVFGLVVMALIYALGSISGAHLNPAVTIGFTASRGFPLARALAYILAQCLGALVASGLLALLMPTSPTLGQTLPTAGIWPAFGLEVALTFILMFVVLNVSTKAMEKGLMAGVAVGATVGLDALFGGPISGASMNPARSLGPALVSGQITDLWIYWVAPIAGSLLACLAAKAVMDPQDWDQSRCRPTDPACDHACACRK